MFDPNIRSIDLKNIVWYHVLHIHYNNVFFKLSFETFYFKLKFSTQWTEYTIHWYIFILWFLIYDMMTSFLNCIAIWMYARLYNTCKNLYINVWLWYKRETKINQWNDICISVEENNLQMLHHIQAWVTSF